MIQRTLAAIAQRQLGLITHDQATQLVTYRTIERLLDRGQWEQVHRGVYRIAGYPVTYEQRVLAACQGAGADAVASHRSAAQIWGLLDEEPSVVEIAVPRPVQHRLGNVIVHRSTDLERADTTVRHGIPVTDPMRTLVDLAAVAPVGTVARGRCTVRCPLGWRPSRQWRQPFNVWRGKAAQRPSLPCAPR